MLAYCEECNIMLVCKCFDHWDWMRIWDTGDTNKTNVNLLLFWSSCVELVQKLCRFLSFLKTRPDKLGLKKNLIMAMGLPLYIKWPKWELDRSWLSLADCKEMGKAPSLLGGEEVALILVPPTQKLCISTHSSWITRVFLSCMLCWGWIWESWLYSGGYGPDYLPKIESCLLWMGSLVVEPANTCTDVPHFSEDW
jgi:hypothetical protein